MVDGGYCDAPGGRKLKDEAECPARTSQKHPQCIRFSGDRRECSITFTYRIVLEHVKEYIKASPEAFTNRISANVSALL
jgi:hypothetical protein